MKRVIELKTIINEIEDKYKPEIDSIKAQLKEITDRKSNELFGYEEELGELLFEYVSGTTALPDYPGVYMRVTKQVNIVDGDSVPTRYWKPDLATVKEYLKDSDYTVDIPGVEVTDKNTVVIRTK